MEACGNETPKGQCLWDRLQSCQIETVIDAVTGKSAHVVFCFYFRIETALAGKFDIMPVSKVDMACPSPLICIPVSFQYSDKGLVTVRIGDSISGFFLFISFHPFTLLCKEHYSKRYFACDTNLMFKRPLCRSTHFGWIEELIPSSLCTSLISERSATSLS
jgi:hypothetical protein